MSRGTHLIYWLCLVALLILVLSYDKHSPEQAVQQALQHSASNTAAMDDKKSFLHKFGDDPVAAATLVVAVATGVLAFSTFQLGRITSRSVDEAARNTKIAQRTLILAQRPRIKIRDIEPDFTVNKEWYFHTGNHVTGDVWIGNAGGSTATVTVWGIHVFWSRRGLPPAWPTTPPSPYPGSDNLPILNAGVHTTLKFQSADIMGEEGHDISMGREDWRLFLLGRVTYNDDLGIARTTAFCRRFQKPEGITGRFVRVDDPDLEYED